MEKCLVIYNSIVIGKKATYIQAEAHSEPCQTSKIKLQAKICNILKLFTIFAKCSVVDVWLGTEYVTAENKQLVKLIWKDNKITKDPVKHVGHFGGQKNP